MHFHAEYLLNNLTKSLIGIYTVLDPTHDLTECLHLSQVTCNKNTTNDKN